MKRYHADGAGELIGRHIRKYLSENESARKTKVTWTPRSTPEMNSVSERANRTIKEMTLALLLDSGLPSVFYKALLHTVYITNLLPTKTSRGHISPVEFLSGELAMSETSRSGPARSGRLSLRLLHGCKYAATWSQFYIPDLDDEIAPVHATFAEQIPPKSQEYYKEIDNLSAEMSDKPDDIVDCMYLV